ncbi:MAG: hypothetical protein ACQGVC_05790 [Myxococcota bacterium]
MHWETALSTTAEVAIGIAGFSAVFAAVARRSPNAWHSTEALALSILLLASASAVFASLLPFLLLDAGLSASSMWSAASALYGVWLLGIVSLRVRQGERLRAATAARRASALVTMAMAAFVLFNAASLRSSWPYVLAVYWQLFVAFSAFLMLLRGASSSE